MNDLTKVTQLDRDKMALANPESAEQVMRIAQRSSGLHKALKGVKGLEEEYYKAFDVMIEAYGIIGKELLAMEKAKGGWPDPNLAVPEGNYKIPTLAELGITKKQSSEWQAIALVPKTDIEEYINARRSDSEAATKADILRMAQNYKTADAICMEESEKVMGALSIFCIRAKDLVIHLRKFPESRRAIPKQFYEQLKLLEEVSDELNRSTL